jgi:membrane dipeptidase
MRSAASSTAPAKRPADRPVDRPGRGGNGHAMNDADPAAVHAATLTLDTHVDIPWPDMPDPAGPTRRRVDFARMAAGGLKAVVFIAYVPQGRRDAAGLAQAAARAEAMLVAIRGTADGTRRRFARGAAELEAAARAGAQVVLAGVENGHALGGELARLARYRELGAIYLTLTHDGHNDLADAARPKPELGDPPSEHGGLSAFGRAVVGELNRLGMLVDVSHAAKPAMLEAAARSRSPVVATHACCRALCEHPRNLDDEQLDALRACGGVLQITAVPAFLRAAPEGRPASASVADMVDHVEHAVSRIGLDHVGLSSDFDGGGGVSGWADASESAGLSAALLARGFGPRELGLLWSGNFLRVLRLAERAAA